MFSKLSKQEIQLSDARPRTGIGPQGDHVTAYGLFREFARGLEGKEPDAIIARLSHVISSVNDFYNQHCQSIGIKVSENLKNQSEEKFDKLFDKAKKKLAKLISTEEIDKVIGKFDPKEKKLIKRTQYALTSFNRFKFEEVATLFLNEYFVLRNQQKYASFPREGNKEPPSGEGARVKNAIKTLKKINESLEKGTFNHLDEKNLNKVIQAMQELFWYPKIDKNALIELTTKKGKKRWEEINKNYKYTKQTEPRDNDLQKLYFVTAQHIDTVCSCFIGMEVYKIAIMGSFVKAVAEDWEMTPKETEAFLEKLKSTYFKEEFEKLSSKETSNPTSETYSVKSDHTSDIPTSDEECEHYFKPKQTPKRLSETPKKENESPKLFLPSKPLQKKDDIEKPGIAKDKPRSKK